MYLKKRELSLIYHIGVCNLWSLYDFGSTIHFLGFRDNLTYILPTNPRWPPFCFINDIISSYHSDNMILCDLSILGSFVREIIFLDAR